jgi:hypothetical protein
MYKLRFKSGNHIVFINNVIVSSGDDIDNIMKGINGSNPLKYADGQNNQDEQSDYSDTTSQSDILSQSDAASQSDTVSTASTTNQPGNLSEWYAVGYILGYGIIVACQIYFFK